MAQPTLDPAFLAMLACPSSKQPLSYDATAGVLVCPCGVRFEFRDGIPNLVLPQATLPAGIATVADLPCTKR